jgi:hypothetical protein
MSSVAGGVSGLLVVLANNLRLCNDSDFERFNFFFEDFFFSSVILTAVLLVVVGEEASETTTYK